MKFLKHPTVKIVAIVLVVLFALAVTKSKRQNIPVLGMI